jgi:hypothetical protein
VALGTVFERWAALMKFTRFHSAELILDSAAGNGIMNARFYFTNFDNFIINARWKGIAFWKNKP